MVGKHKDILITEKSTYSEDFKKIGFLNDFYDELIAYIINSIGENRIIELFEDYWSTEYNDENHEYYSIQSNSIVLLLKPYFNNEEHVNNLFDFLFEDRVIVFNHIFFPEHNGRDAFDYMKILSKLKRIWFNYCKFSTTYLELNNIEVFFQDCDFFDIYSISNSKLLTNTSNVIYQMCIFHQDIHISKMDNKENIIENTLFSDCYFKKEIDAENINFEKGLFNNTKHNEYIEISIIKLINCIINNDFILQGYKIQNLDLSETTFLRKTKIQYGEIKIDANFYNTKFEDLADFYRTKFYKVNFERTDFKNIAVFSEAEFSCDVDFKYTKFLSTSIFRDTIIEEELNLRDTIFKEDANFLDITSKSRKIYDEDKNDYIHIGELEDIKVSNRETARIIKNFFDNSNNILEANRFYKLEMKKREEELEKSFSKGRNIFEYLIFKFHGLSSNHSQNPLLAFFWIYLFSMFYSFFEFNSKMQEYSDKFQFSYFETIFKKISLNQELVVLLIIIGTIFVMGLIFALITKFKEIGLYSIFLLFITILYIIYTKDYSLSIVSNSFNPFSIMTGKDSLNVITLIYKIVIAYLIYQFIISIRQNTRRN
ncbi:pentapeptide repeat-containing protein [Arcobacter caeni]|nr:pentapeptide repeat-containing protein [Arcobacter caeni]